MIEVAGGLGSDEKGSFKRLTGGGVATATTAEVGEEQNARIGFSRRGVFSSL